MDFFRTHPYDYRSIPTPLSQKLLQMDKDLKTREEIANAMHPMRNMKFGMLDGQIDVGYVSVGLGVSLIQFILLEHAKKLLMISLKISNNKKIN